MLLTCPATIARTVISSFLLLFSFIFFLSNVRVTNVVFFLNNIFQVSAQLKTSDILTFLTFQSDYLYRAG